MASAASSPGRRRRSCAPPSAGRSPATAAAARRAFTATGRDAHDRARMRPTATLLAEELVSVRERPGEDPILGFATSFDADDRAVDVELADATALHGRPDLRLDGALLGAARPGRRLPRRPRPRDRPHALEALIAGIRSRGAVAQAYAPVCRSRPGNPSASRASTATTARRNRSVTCWTSWTRAIRNGSDTGSTQYGGAADALGFNGFHLDTYGYPRAPLDAAGQAGRDRRGL